MDQSAAESTAANDRKFPEHLNALRRREGAYYLVTLSYVHAYWYLKKQVLGNS